MTEQRSICVVTQPLSPASESAAKSLTRVLSAITTVSIITANLPANSQLRDRHEIIDISEAGTGTHIMTAALRFVSNQLRICRAIYQRNDDIILFFGTTSYVLPIVFARLIGRIVVLEPRGNVPESLYQSWQDDYSKPVPFVASQLVWVLERIGYRFADGIITLSPSMVEDLQLKKYERKVYQNGAWNIDLDAFQSQIPYQDRDRRVGYVGRLSQEKGIEELVEIVSELPEDITFVFVGDGELRPWIESELADEIEEGRVELTGWVEHDQVPEQLSRLKLFVMTSRTEGLPITILEAMACGTPAYVKPVAGIPDIIEPGETGFLMNDQTPSEAAARLSSLLDSTSPALSQRCQAFVHTEYSYEAAVKRYQEALARWR